MFQLFPFTINDPLPKEKYISNTTKYGYNDRGLDVIEMSCGSGSFPLGFKRDDIVDSVVGKLKEFPFCSPDFVTTNKYVDQLSEKLYNLSNGYYSIYSLSGSDSLESAVRLAQLYHKDRNKIISFKRAYHGSTFMASSLSGHEKIHELFGRFHECVTIDYNEIEEHIDENTKLVIIETASWSNGLPPLGKAYFKHLREVCDKYGALLAIDDIALCGGKVGKTFGFELFDASPDIFCVGKSISGGYFPMSCTMFNQKVSDKIKPQLWFHGFTYSFPMSGILSTLEYLNVLENEKILSLHNQTISLGVNIMDDLIKQELIKDYNRVGVIYSLTPNNVSKSTDLRDSIFYNNGLHMGIWNNDSNRVLLMTPIIPDDEYFSPLKQRLTSALKAINV